MGEHETQESQTITIPCPDGLSPEAHGALTPLVAQQYSCVAILDNSTKDAIALHETKWLIVAAWLVYRRSGKYPPDVPIFESKDFRDRRAFAEFLNEMLEMAQVVMEHFPKLRQAYRNPHHFWQCCLLEWKQWEFDYVTTLHEPVIGKSRLLKWRRDNFLLPLEKAENPFPNTEGTIHNYQLFHHITKLRKTATNQHKTRGFIATRWTPFLFRLRDYIRDQDRNSGLKVVVPGTYGLQYLEKSNFRKRVNPPSKAVTIMLQGF